MRHPSDHPLPYEDQGLWRQQVQLARGHWRREEVAGAVHSAGWWESVTVTWAPAPAPERRPAVLQRVLGSAADVIAPLLVDVAVASAARLLDHRLRAHPVGSSLRRQVASFARELPRPHRTPGSPGPRQSHGELGAG